jgi:hypothetical protein
MNDQPSLDLLLGKIVFHAWFGDHAALYLELGTLKDSGTSTARSSRNPQGEITVYASFDWRVERQRSVFGGSRSSRLRWTSIAKQLLGTTILSAETVGRIPELQLRFSKGLWLETFSCSESQPDWSVSFQALGLGSLCVKKGRIQVDRRDCYRPALASKDASETGRFR